MRSAFTSGPMLLAVDVHGTLQAPASILHSRARTRSPRPLTVPHTPGTPVRGHFPSVAVLIASRSATQCQSIISSP